MSELVRSGYGWGNAEFCGEWTLEELVAFVERVGEIQIEERERAAKEAP